MRLWTLHPGYLDARGLVALWREALLAQAVLRGQTQGYTQHPQLARFRGSTSSAKAIAAYLRPIHTEATQRGYHFGTEKIACSGDVEPISVTQGQLEYEWGHLKAKLQVRAPSWLDTLALSLPPTPHPLFRIIPGGIAEWEVLQSDKALKRTQQQRRDG